MKQINFNATNRPFLIRRFHVLLFVIITNIYIIIIILIVIKNRSPINRNN